MAPHPQIQPTVHPALDLEGQPDCPGQKLKLLIGLNACFFMYYLVNCYIWEMLLTSLHLIPPENVDICKLGIIIILFYRLGEKKLLFLSTAPDLTIVAQYWYCTYYYVFLLHSVVPWTKGQLGIHRIIVLRLYVSILRTP